MDDLVMRHGVPDSLRHAAALLYEDAFGRKFARAIGRKEQRVAVVEQSLQPEHAFCALHNGALVGIAGYHSRDGSFTGGLSGPQLLQILGVGRGAWAALVLSLFERRPAPGELLMDGIAVHAAARGQGVGTLLLAQVAVFAGQNGHDRVRLDVIDTNPRARRLYERNGFHAVRTERFPYLRWLLGFGAATTMERLVSGSDQEVVVPTRR